MAPRQGLPVVVSDTAREGDRVIVVAWLTHRRVAPCSGFRFKMGRQMQHRRSARFRRLTSPVAAKVYAEVYTTIAGASKYGRNLDV